MGGVILVQPSQYVELLTKLIERFQCPSVLDQSLTRKYQKVSQNIQFIYLSIGQELMVLNL